MIILGFEYVSPVSRKDWSKSRDYNMWLGSELKVTQYCGSSAWRSWWDVEPCCKPSACRQRSGTARAGWRRPPRATDSMSPPVKGCLLLAWTLLVQWHDTTAPTPMMTCASGTSTGKTPVSSNLNRRQAKCTSLHGKTVWISLTEVPLAFQQTGIDCEMV